MSRMRVLIVDDHSTIRQMIKIILKSYPDVDVVGEATNGQEAVAAADMLQPSIIVIDVNMPLMNGIEATRMVKSRHPAITIIGLSANPNDEYRKAMKDAGAATLLRKETAVEALYEAIRKGVEEIPNPVCQPALDQCAHSVDLLSRGTADYL